MIVSTSSTSPLQTRLEAGGLSAAKAKLVQSDLDAALTDAAATGGTPLSVRAALDKRIAADQASGKLSAADAKQITATLDEIDGQAAGTTATTAAGPAKRGGAKGGGGGGDTTTQTELSRTVVVTGAVKTTTITYTDGSTTTETRVATKADAVKYARAGTRDTDAPQDNAGIAAQAYLSTIEPGSLLEQLA